MKIYVACDSSGSTSGPTGSVTTTPANPGSILEFTFQPSGAKGWEQLIVGNKETVDVMNVEVYPNPASSYFIVYNYATSNERVLELTDIGGRTIRRLNTTTKATRIECSNLVNGIYVLKVSDKQGKLEKAIKILVKK
jgi:hypothetical protein